MHSQVDALFGEADKLFEQADKLFAKASDIMRDTPNCQVPKPGYQTVMFRTQTWRERLNHCRTFLRMFCAMLFRGRAEVHIKRRDGKN